MLEVKNLRKEYGSLTAVRGISFDLQPGDIFGFIGSNGAGKTTTIRMISTLLEPTSGTALLSGADIRRDPMAVRRMIGYMPDFFGLYDDVKVWEYLDFFAAIYQVPVKQRMSVIDNVLELTDLTVKKNAFVQSLSRGMQQRLCLARCLVHDPQLLLLDEPASGLDPRARAELKELIAELGRMGKIVIVSSHILPELADFCNTVGIIEKGELLAFGPVGQIVQGIQAHRVIRIRYLGSNGDLKHFVEGRPHVSNVELAGDGELRVDFQSNEEDQAALLAAIVQADFKVVGFREEEADLEDVFLRLTTGAVQ
jgi:ABC-2 type transport system ATP-binding protein